MVTKSQIKHIAGLKQKKYRNLHGLFVAEGQKMVKELLNAGFTPYALFAEDPKKLCGATATAIVSPSEIKQMSSLNTPNGVLGVFYQPQPRSITPEDWVVALDAVRDPGNLGTIIRLCDWFGIRHVLCSPDTVDCYNPKVLQATMGSIARVNLVYGNLCQYLKAINLPLYGACMEGKSVYTRQLPKSGILLMGSEAHGISKNLQPLLTQRIAVPQFGHTTAESLNVATATAILLSEIRR